MYRLTDATPTLSTAVILTRTDPLDIAPLAGAAIDTLGGVVSGTVLFTVTITLPEKPVLAEASAALAASVWAPFVSLSVFQEYW